MEAGHRDLRLGVFGGFGFVDLDADTWRGRRVPDAALDPHGADYFVPPGDSL
jgi:hypothetical protein